MLKLGSAIFITVVLAILIWWFGFSPAKDVIVKCETTKGPIEFVIKPSWSPLGAKRFLQLVDDGYYTQLPLFRCMNGFVCQFGVTVPRKGLKNYSAIHDDPKRAELRSFRPGYLSFAGYGANTRSTHVFIALGAAESLGAQSWETPFGHVSSESMNTLWKFSTVYGESAPASRGPEPRKIQAPDGVEYLKQFPELDYFQSCSR